MISHQNRNNDITPEQNNDITPEQELRASEIQDGRKYPSITG